MAVRARPRRCEHCNKAFRHQNDLDRHNNSRVHNGNPPKFRCQFTLKANGKQCDVEVRTQECNLIEHIEAEHLNWTYVCKLCQISLNRYTKVLKHVKSCRKENNIPDSDKRHPIEFMEENFDDTDARMPADPPEDWVNLKPHSLRILEMRRKREVTQSQFSIVSKDKDKAKGARHNPRRVKANLKRPATPVEGEVRSKLQALESYSNPNAIARSIRHCKEVREPTLQSQQVPEASLWRILNPLNAASDKKDRFPTIRLGNSAGGLESQLQLEVEQQPSGGSRAFSSEQLQRRPQHWRHSHMLEPSSSMRLSRSDTQYERSPSPISEGDGFDELIDSDELESPSTLQTRSETQYGRSPSPISEGDSFDELVDSDLDDLRSSTVGQSACGEPPEDDDSCSYLSSNEDEGSARAPDVTGGIRTATFFRGREGHEFAKCAR